MNKKFEISRFLNIIFTLFFLYSCSQTNLNNSKTEVRETLNYPFGTLVKLKIKVIDGNELKLKKYSNSYLIQIIEVNDNKLSKSTILEFLDESEEFPTNDFDLFKSIYGKETENLSSEMIKKMNKNYVGKIFNVLGYESGKFSGSPINSEYVENKIKPFNLVKQDISFQFINFIVITRKLDE